VQAAQACKPDVILCQERRPNPATAKARMIPVIGCGSQAERLWTAEAGFDTHLTMPADRSAVQDLLSRSNSPN
jgi:hypothetical protein